MKTSVKSYDQKIVNTLIDFLILKSMKHDKRSINGLIHYGITGKEVLLKLRAIGVSVSETTIYEIFGRLRRNGLITKGRQETDFDTTEVTYYLTKTGEKYLSQTKELLRAITD